MSRSRRHTPVHGTACGSHGSEKWDKQKANRKYRRAVKIALAKKVEPPILLGHTNSYNFYKDGHFWFDPIKYPKLMRK